MIMVLLLFVPSLAVASDTSKVNQSMISFDFRSSKAIDDQHRLLIDNFLGKIECIDLATFTQLWEKKFDFIYDIRIMNNPSKIIVIAKDRGKVMKFTLSTEGESSDAAGNCNSYSSDVDETEQICPYQLVTSRLWFDRKACRLFGRSGIDL
ncbi:hypothetical protein [Paenibacillus terrigena]|uniref:hypothetical protein n=1 Tax=Paenibacillus terrigena TaxID=369333 RepID=UPI001B7FAF59|nr:hypothetical protein [Paenibacillus terrigena]